jgi:hypothetical protein
MLVSGCGGARPESTASRCHASRSARALAIFSPERVWQVTELTLRQDFPALRSLEATLNNLLQQVTTFVGREREIGAVWSRWRAHAP